MTNISILSWNVNDLNTPSKRTSCLDLLRRKKIDVAMIQESHLIQHDVSRLANKYYYVAAFSAAENKTKGALIIL